MTLFEILVSDLQAGTFDKVYEYLCNVPIDQEHKDELIDSIRSFPLEPLYDSLFEDFGELLTYDEYLFHRGQYLAYFSCALPAVCGVLDEYHGIVGEQL